MRLNNENAAMLMPPGSNLGIERLFMQTFSCFTQNSMSHDNKSALKATSELRSKQEMHVEQIPRHGLDAGLLPTSTIGSFSEKTYQAKIRSVGS